MGRVTLITRYGANKVGENFSLPRFSRMVLGWPNLSAVVRSKTIHDVFYIRLPDLGIDLLTVIVCAMPDFGSPSAFPFYRRLSSEDWEVAPFSLRSLKLWDPRLPFESTAMPFGIIRWFALISAFSSAINLFYWLRFRSKNALQDTYRLFRSLVIQWHGSVILCMASKCCFHFADIA